MVRKFLIPAIILGWCAAGLGDVVIFKSGDKLTGKLVKLENGKLTFIAEEVGSVDLDICKIQQFSADEPAELHFSDGTVIKSRILSAEPGQFRTEKTQLLPAQTFALGDLAAVNPPPKPKPKWTGSVTAGLSSTHGNTFTESGSVSFDAKRRSEIDRTTLYGLYLVQRAEEEQDGEKEKVTTEESFLIGGKYDYFFTKKLFGFINSSYKKDHIADLDRRIIVGAGLGYQWLESEKMNFNTDIGLAELCEKYTTEDQVTQTDAMSLQMGYHFDWTINDKLVFMHNLTYYPSLEGFSDYFLTTDAEIRATITKSMFTNLKVMLDYDATPADNIGSTDTKYILGIGWNF